MTADDNMACLHCAMRYLEISPRTEQELRQYLLRKKKFSDYNIEEVMARLKKAGMVDDRVFAELWCKSRNEHKPKSRNMVKYELLKKGIDVELAKEATAQLNDFDNAYKSAIKKAGTIKKADYPVFYRQLSGYLTRKGYAQEIVTTTIKRVWIDINNSKK